MIQFLHPIKAVVVIIQNKIHYLIINLNHFHVIQINFIQLIHHHFLINKIIMKMMKYLFVQFQININFKVI